MWESINQKIDITLICNECRNDLEFEIHWSRSGDLMIYVYPCEDCCKVNEEEN